MLPVPVMALCYQNCHVHIQITEAAVLTDKSSSPDGRNQHLNSFFIENENYDAERIIALCLSRCHRDQMNL